MQSLTSTQFKPDPNLCPHCRVFKEICLCDQIRRFVLKTRLTLLVHVKEFMRITNTGRLALYSLENSQAVLKGDIHSKYHSSELFPKDYHSILLTPYASSVLNLSFIQTIAQPINLIVPDGTWQQVRRLVNSDEKLYRIPHVRLPAAKTVNFALRKAPQENFFSTLGAVAQAFGILENNELQVYLEGLLITMTQRLKKRSHRKQI